MYHIYSAGIIEVIAGPMFSGKTEELIRRIRILTYGRVKILVIKPKKDTRWKREEVITRNGGFVKAISVNEPKDIINQVVENNYDAIAIDEAQFFDDSIVEVVQKLAQMKKRVLIAGLDQNYHGEPFGPMPKLLAIADIVEKQQAVCLVCGKAATMTFKKANSKDLIEVGDKNLYEARCRECHSYGEHEKKSAPQPRQRTGNTRPIRKSGGVN